MTTTGSTTLSSAQRVRLHITPFNPTLFDTVIPKSTQSIVTSVSYHHIQNDPARNFGFLELPAGEADRLRTRLNGTFLRGVKMSIEKARPEKRKAPHGDKAEDGKALRPKKKLDRKVESGEKITGVELPPERKVKRGWTDNGNGSSNKAKTHVRDKSKYSNKEEALFRTGRTRDESAGTKTREKGRKAKKEVVHEFEKTSKFPSFLKQTETKRQGGSLTFVDGQGWVDEDGQVVEAVKARKRHTTAVRPETENSGSALGISGLQKETSADAQPKSASPQNQSESDDTSSASGTSSTSGSSGDEESQTVVQSRERKSSTPQQIVPTKEAKSREPSRSTEMGPPSIITTPVPDAAPVKSIHPLEALYKRRPEDLPKVGRLDTSFAFGFGSEDGERGIPVNSALFPPQTPYTQQDSRFRGIRSAAPTPDTAVATRKFFPDVQDGDEDEDNDDDDNGDDDDDDDEGSEDEAQAEQTRSNTASNTAVADGGERSAFVKEFYERRSELNRGFKDRRREAKKQLRQKEDKKRIL